jgi:glycosyltransferase involved in cell wall biosynthesis
MKILYLCADHGIPVLGRKGAAVHVRAMIRAFSQAGHSVILASPVLTKSPWEEPAKIEAPVVHVPTAAEMEAPLLAAREFGDILGESADAFPADLRRILYNREIGRQLRRRFRDDPPDFIYERASLYATAGVTLARALQRPLLMELNAPLAMEQATYRSSALDELAVEAEKWALTRADAVLAVSCELRDYALGLGVEPGRAHVVLNGVDTEMFSPEPAEPMVRERWGLTDGPVLGFVGGLRPWHGFEVLPELLERVVRTNPGSQLLIVGEGPLRRTLECEMQARGLGGSAVFTGALAQGEVASLVRHFDVALAPYQELKHAFYFSPLKLFEYMASGVAVAAPRLGQIAEILRDGETGLLYPPGDIEALTKSCLRLLQEPELRTRLGRAAANEVRVRHTWGGNAARVVQIAGCLRSSIGVPE